MSPCSLGTAKSLSCMSSAQISWLDVCVEPMWSTQCFISSRPPSCDQAARQKDSLLAQSASSSTSLLDRCLLEALSNADKRPTSRSLLRSSVRACMVLAVCFLAIKHHSGYIKERIVGMVSVGMSFRNGGSHCARAGADPEVRGPSE